MPIRSRVRGLLRRVRGRAESTPAPPSPATTPPAPRPSAPQQPQAPPASSSPPSPNPTPSATPSAASGAAPAPKKISEEKRRRHKLKAQRGVLRFLDQQGGSAEMAAMHDFSERRYFVAHQGFSRMMEFFVNEELIAFDHASGTATLTEEGRRYMNSPIA